MNLHKLPSLVGRKKRQGRGIGSRGAKSGRGMKGQKARAGFSSKAGFEGGQTPIYMRFPKGKGTKQVSKPQRVKPLALKVDRLNVFQKGGLITLGVLRKRRLIRKDVRSVKLIDGGEVKVKLTVRIQAATPGAKKAVEMAGGKVETIK